MQWTFYLSTIVLLGTLLSDANIRKRRNIDLTATHAMLSDFQLPRKIVPTSYVLDIRPNLENNTFEGIVQINLKWMETAKEIVLHANNELNVNEETVKLATLNSSNNIMFNIRRIDRTPKKMILTIHLGENVRQGTIAELHLEFKGYISTKMQGLFKTKYNNKNTFKDKIYLATYMRPNNARRLFPCFDEPNFKVPFTVTISRPKDYVTLFNTPVISNEVIGDNIIDKFETTPPMATFSFGFVICQFSSWTGENDVQKPSINIWTDDAAIAKIKESLEVAANINTILNNYFNSSLPIQKMDIVLLPNMPQVNPVDNWGLLMFRASDFFTRGHNELPIQLTYQWLGCWATPYWWVDAPLNKALASFIAIQVSLKLKDDKYLEKYPMTILYSLYYELSKRYPHSRITGMKHETAAFKIEVLIRMVHRTIGNRAFRNGVRKLIAKAAFRTFLGEEFWDYLSTEAITAGTLNSNYQISQIAESWISKDRLPMVTIRRNYNNKSIEISQKVFLRERPHDVPNQEKMLWWIPLFIVHQEKNDFLEVKPEIWLENKKKTQIKTKSENNNYIICNPDEIGPYLVNYDLTNWNYLSQYLQTEEGRKKIPKLTRAKLMHDAWNLAYAGDLNFATALNMTLFMQYEIEPIVWLPFFTFIDHVGKKIEISTVYKKFESYIKKMLGPLYDNLEGVNEPNNLLVSDLKSLAQTFTCRAGYKACIEKSRKIFSRWMGSSDPNTFDAIEKQHICPVFRWGSMEEFTFGIERVKEFPNQRIRSERTFILKMLAICPAQSEKILFLLNQSIIVATNNFSDNDIILITKLLTGSSIGYTTLFEFIKNNWSLMKQRYRENSYIWDAIIGSATGFFITERGYLMVQSFKTDHLGQFGSAEHIIENSLKKIKEEAAWTTESLPVIDSWLTNFLKSDGLK